MVTGQLADAIGDFACLVFLFGSICETASCPVRELAYPRVVQLPFASPCTCFTVRLRCVFVRCFRIVEVYSRRLQRTFWTCTFVRMRSTGAVHTSATARLTWIHDTNRNQNVIVCSLAHCQSSLKISCKSVRKFLGQVANRQTDGQTENNDDYITSSAEVVKSPGNKVKQNRRFSLRTNQISRQLSTEAFLSEIN